MRYFALAVVVLAGVLLAPSRAMAAQVPDVCGFDGMLTPLERLDLALAEWSDLVVVGVVTQEEMKPQPSLAGDSRAEDAVFRSTVRVEAVLKGEAPSETLTLPFLGTTQNCISGLRLREGERVLLMLREVERTGSSGMSRTIWESSYVGGQVRLVGGHALLDDYPSLQSIVPDYLGPADALIRELALRLESPDDVREAALAAAGPPIQATRSSAGWSDWLIAGIASLTALGFGLRAIVLSLGSRPD